MKRLLLDTNILSEITKREPEPRAVAFLQRAEIVFISVVTLHELHFGLMRLPEGRRRTELIEQVESLISNFESSILKVTQPEAIRSADLRAQAQSSGHTLHLADSLIAATAIEHGLTLVTRNVSDFEGTGLSIINPWQT